MTPKNWRKELRHSSRTGTLLDISGVSGGEPLPSEVLRDVLCDSSIIPRGRRLVVGLGVLSGPLDLSNVETRVPLSLVGVSAPEPLDLSGGKLSSIRFLGCNLSNVIMDEAEVQGSLELVSTSLLGGLSALGAVVRGTVFAQRCQLWSDSSPSLALDRADIRGGLFLRDSQFTNQLRLLGAHVRGQVLLDRTHWIGHEAAIRLDGATIDDLVSLEDVRSHSGLYGPGARFGSGIDAVRSHFLGGDDAVAIHFGDAECRGRICLDDSVLGGAANFIGLSSQNEISMQRIEIRALPMPSVMLDATRITGDINLTEAVLAGAVTGFNAKVAGDLILTGASIDGGLQNGVALNDVDIDGTLTMDRLDLRGNLRVVDVRTGRIDLSHASLRGWGDYAFNFNRTVVRGSMVLTAAKLQGSMSLQSARVGGDIVLRDAAVTGHREWSLLMDGIECFNVFASGLRTNSSVLMQNARVHHQMILERAQLSGQGSAFALLLDGSSFAALVQLEDSVLRGGLRAIESKFAGQFRLLRATLLRTEPYALEMDAAECLRLFLPSSSNGVGLDSTQIGTLVGPTSRDHARHLVPLSAVGWSFGDIRGGFRRDHRGFREWLESRPKFSAQPWWEAARVFDLNGHPVQARRMRVWAAFHSTVRSPVRSQPLGWLYGVLTGWGYLPLVTALWFIALVISVAGLAAHNDSHFRPSDLRAASAAYSPGTSEHEVGAAGLTFPTGESACGETGAYPCFRPLVFAASTVSPASVLTTPAWQPSESMPLEISLLVAKLGGWLLSIIFVAGLAGLLRRH